MWKSLEIFWQYYNITYLQCTNNFWKHQFCINTLLFWNRLILKHFTEQAKLVTYLRAQQNIEQSTADEQSGPWEQMGFSHLNSDPRTFNITEESPMTPDVQSGPWILKEYPQLESQLVRWRHMTQMSQRKPQWHLMYKQNKPDVSHSESFRCSRILLQQWHIIYHVQFLLFVI